MDPALDCQKIIHFILHLTPKLIIHEISGVMETPGPLDIQLSLTLI